ncbi:MAG TPA: PspC domain-containing protein [Candidatus Nanoarchaeia archaeon]|nr:PspC domain-containing protein [Candidatus Nanoarchaeia archaeon]
MNKTIKRLYRSRRDKVIGGVCGGIARYLDVNPVVVRLVWAIGTLISMGAGLLAYLIAWIIVPEEPSLKQKS